MEWIIQNRIMREEEGSVRIKTKRRVVAYLTVAVIWRTIVHVTHNSAEQFESSLYS